jgi:hypothetical protein
VGDDPDAGGSKDHECSGIFSCMWAKSDRSVKLGALVVNARRRHRKHGELSERVPRFFFFWNKRSKRLQYITRKKLN